MRKRKIEGYGQRWRITMSIVMKSLRTFSSVVVLTIAALSVPLVVAHEGHRKQAPAAAAGELVPVTDKDVAWVAEQKATHPTNVCIVSHDKLNGDMGEALDFIYRVTGKPDRLISLCCKDCVRDFNKDPEKYLALLDHAAAKESRQGHDSGHRH